MNGSSRLPGARRRQDMRPPPTKAHHARNVVTPAIQSSPVVPTSAYSQRGIRNGSLSPIRLKRKLQDEDNATNIQVVVRCRGRNDREKEINSAVIVSMPGGANGKDVALTMDPLSTKDNKFYTFDGAFGPEADQGCIYDGVVEPILNEMLDGYNCTIFAYGQTGTGKTYTMTGDMSDQFGSYTDGAGIIPRTLYNLFRHLGPNMDDNTVKCSFIELYNEELRDLLAQEVAQPQQLKIFDDSNKKGGVFVQGIEESFIKTAQEGLQLLRDGSHKRQVAATRCNDLSSRSHTVFTITVHAKDTSDDGDVMVRCGKLNLVDLAGSENIGRSGAENKRAREAGMINQSLLTLGRVINALVDKSPHIPYRESKLTRLLQDSLGGRTKTCIIATISPAKSNAEETISTLDYASRAKNIKNKPQANHLLSKKTMLQEYVIEIEKLKADLKATRSKHGVYLTNEHHDEMVQTLETRRILLEEDQRKMDLMENQLKKKQEQYEKTMRKLFETETSLGESLQKLDELDSEVREIRSQLDTMTKDWEREHALRKAHERTEDALYSRGQELISTLEPAVKDITQLHSKIGRMADAEIQNYTMWMKNTQVVENNADRIESKLIDFEKNQCELADTLNDRVTKFMEHNYNRMQQTAKFIDDRVEAYEQKEKELSEQTRISKEQMNGILEEMKDLREDIKTRIGEGLKGLNDAAEQMAAGVIHDLGKFGKDLHESYTRLTEDFDKTMEDNRVHMARQKSEIEGLRMKIEETTTKTAKTSADAHRTLETVLIEERAQNALGRQTLISQITSLINTSAEIQDKRLTERVEAVRTDLDTTRAVVEAAAKEHEEQMDKLAASNESFLESLATSRVRIHDSIVRDQENFAQHNDTIKATANSIHAKTVELVEVQTENIGIQMESLDEFVTRAREQNELHHATFEGSLQVLSNNARETFDEWSQDINVSHEQFDQFSNDIQADVDQILTNLQPYQDATQESVNQLRDNIQAKQYREYKPSGATPKKRKYEYPRMLPRTDHNEILGRLTSGGGVVAGTSSQNNTPRIPLSPKKVNQPVINNPDDMENGTKADPRAGGAGIGAAFYPNKAAALVFGHLDLGDSSGGLMTTPSHDDEPPRKRPRSARLAKRAVSYDAENLTMPDLGVTTRNRHRR